MSGSYNEEQFNTMNVTDKVGDDDGEIQYIQLIGPGHGDEDIPSTATDALRTSSHLQEHDNSNIEGHIFHVEDDNEPVNLTQPHLMTANGLDFNQSIIVSNMGQESSDTRTVDISNIASLVNTPLQLPISSQPSQVNPGSIQVLNSSSLTASTIKQEMSAAEGFHGPDGQIFYVKQDNINGQMVTSVVDPTNKPVALPMGTQMISLPQLPPSNSVVPLSDGEQPLYVNPKQYNRILKRRVARAKLEAEGKIPKFRAKYIHESRHRHAQRRVRGPGGKFLSKIKTDPETDADKTSTRTPRKSKKGKENFTTSRSDVLTSVPHLAYIDMDQLKHIVSDHPGLQ